jgi:hypothetical protein
MFDESHGTMLYSNKNTNTKDQSTTPGCGSKHEEAQWGDSTSENQASTSRSVSRPNLKKMGKIRRKLRRAVGFSANSRPILGVPVGISTVWKVMHRCTPTKKAFPRRISRQTKIQLSRPGENANLVAADRNSVADLAAPLSRK